MASLLLRGAIVFSVACLALTPVSVASAATQSRSSDEVGGSSVAARTATQNLRSTWAAQVVANGGTLGPVITLNQPTYANGSPVSGVINTATDGTTTSLTRTRYSAGASPTLVGSSTTAGTATCTNASTTLQSAAPRPTSLVSNATCSTSAGFAYAQAGGVGENTTRDAVELSFSRPILGFGAWFGDLETRTDGSGVAAIVRLYGVGGALLSDQVVQPGPSYLPQRNCNNTYVGCGNDTTRFLSFIADPALPVTRMVVIVGDDDAAGSALDEGLSLIGPTLDLSSATISLAKSAQALTDTNADGNVGVGDTVRYNFAVTNTGSVPVSGLAITDAGATGLSCPAGSVAAGAVATCTGNHVLTQAQVDSGSFANTARATGTAYAGTITSNASTTVVPIVSRPGLNLTKTVDEPTFAAVGDVVDFEVTVANSGNVTLTGVSVSDPNPGGGTFTSTCASVPGTLAPGAAASCDVSYRVTQADLDAGTVANVATATAVSPGSVPVGPVTATSISSAIQRVNLTLSKSVDQQSYDAVGDTLTYTVTASNNGNVTLTDVAVADPAPGDGAFSLDCSGLPATLAPGAVGTCNATYQTTQDDLDEGAVTNVASATAAAAGNVVTAPDAEATSTVVTRPGLSIVKTVDEPTFTAVGDLLTYTVTVTNTSNVTVRAVSVTDEAPGPGAFDVDCSDLPGVLVPNAGGTCTVTYTVTQADLDGGSVVNSAEASAQLPTNAVVRSMTASASSNAEQTVSLSLVKATDVESYDSVGDVLAYSLTVTNGGNVTLSDVVVADPAPGDGAILLDCGDLPSTLGPGEVGTCTAEYRVTQDDLNAGSVTNVASATATAPSGDVAHPDSEVTVTAEQNPALTATKSVDSATYIDAGDDLTYTITITNSGNVMLTEVAVTDAPPGAGAFSLDCDSLPADLAPGAAGTCTATYEVTQGDVDAGSVTNTAAAAANGPNGPIGTAAPPVTSTAEPSASIELVKTSDVTSVAAAGDPVVYTFVSTNTGNVTLTSVVIVDPLVGLSPLICDLAAPVTLAPDASLTCTATYVVTQTDADAGQVSNTATTVAEAPGGDPNDAAGDVADTDDAVVEIPADLDITLVKDADPTNVPAAGEVVTYTFTAANLGNQTLTNVRIVDPLPGLSELTCDPPAPARLASGQVLSCTATYVITQQDADAGGVENLATVSGEGPNGDAANDQDDVTASDSASVTVGPAPAIELVKAAVGPDAAVAGSVIRYTFLATNTGNVTLGELQITDILEGLSELECEPDQPTTLAPTETLRCSADYVVTVDDVGSGGVLNTATVNGTPPGEGAEPVSDDDSLLVQLEGVTSLELEKTANDESVRRGETIVYTLVATNTGTVALSDVEISDLLDGLSELDCAPTQPVELSPGEQLTCTATYRATSADADNGQVNNSATVRAETPGGETVTVEDSVSTDVRRAGGDGGDDDDGDDDDGDDDSDGDRDKGGHGSIASTGGPWLGWLAVGGLLMAGGTGALLTARRRRQG